MLGFPLIVAVAFGVGAWALPETPRWWLSNDRIDRARAALQRFRDAEDVDQELDQIRVSLGSRTGSWSDLLSAVVRPALMIGIGLGILQRVTGVTIAILYGPTIFKFAGMQSVSMDTLAGLGVGAAFLAGQVLYLVLVDHLGRRPLLLLGYGGMLCGLVALALAFAMGGDSSLGQGLAVVGVMVLAGAWAAGPGSVTYLLISELYPQRVRGPAMSVATVAIWLSFLVMSVTFLSTVEILGESLTFWAYAVACVLAMAIAYRFVPETKGRNLEEISAGPMRRD